MSVTFRAADEPVTSRREYWQHVAANALGRLELWGDESLDERDRMVVGQAGAVRVGTLYISAPGGADRTRRHLRSSDPDLCKVDLVAEGTGVVAQDGREARLRRGDLALVDLTRPAHWRMSAARIVAVIFPRSLLPLRPDELGQLTAMEIPGDRGAGALVSSLADELAAHVDDVTPADAARLGTAVLDVLSVALTARLGPDRAAPADTRQRVLLHRIHAFIDQRLGDPDLTPATIAAAHHISLRYLHKLFEPGDQTVAGWIRQRRLERCRRDLRDPLLRDRPVSAIAARWGITSAGRFSRLFRAAYDMTPVMYRELRLGRPPGGDRPKRGG